MSLAFFLSRRARLLAFGAVGLTAALTSLSGCGGDDSDTDGSGGGDTGPKLPYSGLDDEPFAAPASSWSHGEPSNLEQALLEEVQRARRDPGGQVEIVLAVPGVKGAMQQFKTDEQQLRDDFTTYSAVPPLSFDAKLQASARFHSEDMAKNGFQQHDGSAGESFSDRIDVAGYDWSAAAENIFAYADSVPFCHAAFMVDWGNPDPGHRKAILDIGSAKRDIGISIIEMPESPAVGPLVVTQDFGAPANPPANAQKYIVGVVYTDANENHFYDPGEGVPGLMVVPDVGDYMAVTSQSGGFSVPMPANIGPVKVQLQLTSKGEQYVIGAAETNLAGQNVKVDFVLPAAKE